MLKHALSAYTSMTEEELQLALYMGVRLNLHRLPQLKGRGRVIGAGAHDEAAHIFAKSIAEHFRLSDIILMKGPGLAPAPSAHGGTK